MKGADHVLSERVIDRGLAADRRIHLCEQRGRDLNEGHAALIGGGGEPRQIPDYPTPQGDEGGITRAPAQARGRYLAGRSRSPGPRPRDKADRARRKAPRAARAGRRPATGVWTCRRGCAATVPVEAREGR